MLDMDKQSVLIGEIAIEGVPPVVVHADLSGSRLPLVHVAELKDKLASVLGERFRPAMPERNKDHRLSHAGQ